MIKVSSGETYVGWRNHLSYAANDAGITLRVWRALKESLPPSASWVYEMEKRLAGQLMVIGMRGLRVDEEEARRIVGELRGEAEKIAEEAEELVRDRLLWPEFNLGSEKQMKALLHGEVEERVCPRCGWSGREVTVPALVEFPGRYKAGPKKGLWKIKIRKERSRKCEEPHTYPGLKLTPYHDREGKITVGQKKLHQMLRREKNYLGTLTRSTPKSRRAQLGIQIVELRLRYMELDKLAGALEAPRGKDGRYHGIIEPGTDTLRTHSSSDPWGGGSNLQNLSKRIREPFVPDPGYRLFVRDLARAESHLLSVFALDPDYIEAHETPGRDTHTFVAQLCKGVFEVDWTGDWTADKKLANSIIHPASKHSIRHTSKTIQHAKTRYQQPKGTAEVLGCGVGAALELEEAFFGAFPKVRWFMDELVRQLSYYKEIHLGTGEPLGIERLPNGGGPRLTIHLEIEGEKRQYSRTFRTRPDDPETARRAISHALQSPVRIVLNIGLDRIWRELDGGRMGTGRSPLEVLNDNHDALLYQIREGEEHLDLRAAELMRVPLGINGRTLELQTDVGVGMNWKECG